MKSKFYFVFFLFIFNCSSPSVKNPEQISLDPEKKEISCSNDNGCAVLGAIGTAAAVVKGSNPPEYSSGKKDGSIVLKCQMKGKSSGMSFPCGPVRVSIRAADSAKEEVLRFQGENIVIPNLSKGGRYNLKIESKGSSQKIIDDVSAGEVHSVVFEI